MTNANSSPWERAEAKIVRLLDRVADNDDGPVQGVIIEEMFGYGSIRILDRLARIKQSAGQPGPVYLSSRHDSLTDWPSLVVEILSVAFIAGCPHGKRREELAARREAFGEAAFRDAMDELLQQQLVTHGRLDLFIPNFDAMLTKLDPNDHWAFRNILQTLPLAVVGTADANWRPSRDDAFYEFFNRTTPDGYLEQDLPDLAKKAGLKKSENNTLTQLYQEISGRPNLVETAAIALSTDPQANSDSILRYLATTGASAMHSALANTAKQELLVMAAITRLGTPTGSGDIANLTGLRTGAVSTHLARLVANGLLVVDKTRGRNRQYQFTDSVFGVLFSSLNADVAEWTRVKG